MLQAMVTVVGEFLFQAVVQALVDLGLCSLVEPFRRPPDPWLAALGHTLLGAAFGGASLLLMPDHLVPGAWPWANLVVTPLAVGGLMAGVAAWRAPSGPRRWPIDRFVHGCLFALALALVRFSFAG